MGKFLDPLADKLLVSAAFIMLIELQIAPAWIVIVIISREFAITGFRLVASGEGVVLAASSMGKQKTVSQILADRKSTRLNSSHVAISYAVFCLKKKNTTIPTTKKTNTR